MAGIALAAFLFLGERRLAKGIAESAPGRALSTLWFNAWGFDWLYDLIWVKPYLLATRLLGKDPLDRMMNLPAVLAQGASAAGLDRLRQVALVRSLHGDGRRPDPGPAAARLIHEPNIVWQAQRLPD